jgi:hypothetical protein
MIFNKGILTISWNAILQKQPCENSRIQKKLGNIVMTDHTLLIMDYKLSLLLGNAGYFKSFIEIFGSCKILPVAFTL